MVVHKLVKSMTAAKQRWRIRQGAAASFYAQMPEMATSLKKKMDAYLEGFVAGELQPTYSVSVEFVVGGVHSVFFTRLGEWALKDYLRQHLVVGYRLPAETLTIEFLRFGGTLRTGYIISLVYRPELVIVDH